VREANLGGGGGGLDAGGGYECVDEGVDGDGDGGGIIVLFISTWVRHPKERLPDSAGNDPPIEGFVYGSRFMKEFAGKRGDLRRRYHWPDVGRWIVQRIALVGASFGGDMVGLDGGGEMPWGEGYVR
jgi:hypothetical protein